MTQLMLVTADKSRFADFAEGIQSSGGTVRWASTGEQAVALLAEASVDLVVADEDLGDMTGLNLADRLVRVNPLINSAVVSSLTKEAFHEASEGLGILMALPPRPNKSDAERLLAHASRILDLTEKSIE